MYISINDRSNIDIYKIIYIYYFELDSMTIINSKGSMSEDKVTKTSLSNSLENTKNKVKKPISACGCDTDHNNGKYITENFEGKKIYFCTEDCKFEFIEDPLQFLNSDHFVLEFENLEKV